MLQLAGLGPPLAAYSCLHVADANCVSKPLYTQAGTGGRSKKERRPRSPATTSTGASRAQRASPSPLAEGRSDLCGWGPGASCGRITLWGYSAVSSSRLLAGGDGGVKTVPPGAHLEPLATQGALGSFISYGLTAFQEKRGSVSLVDAGWSFGFWTRCST